MIGTRIYPDEWNELRQDLLRRMKVAEEWGVDAVAIDAKYLLNLMATIELQYTDKPACKVNFP